MDFFLPVCSARTDRFLNRARLAPVTKDPNKRNGGSSNAGPTRNLPITISTQREGRPLIVPKMHAVIFSFTYVIISSYICIRDQRRLISMCTFNNLPCFVSYLFFLNDQTNDVTRSRQSTIPIIALRFLHREGKRHSPSFYRLQIAPPATPLQDFTYHWKQLMNFYVNHLTDCKVPIQTTGIPRHLDRLLEILLEEEKDETEPGPCLEYLLQHKLLDLLATLASAETPPGMRTICLSFLRKLLGRSKYPLLHHTSIYGPVQRLIGLCNGSPPSPMEAEEVQFLLTICFLVCKYPHVTNIINDAPTVQRHNASAAGRSSERMEVEKVTYIPARRRNNFNPLFEPLDTRAVTLINPNLFSTENDRRLRFAESNRPSSKTETTRGSSSQSNGSISSRDVENASQSSSPIIQKPISDESSVVAASSSDSQDYDVSQKGEDVALMNEIDTHLQNLQDLRLDVEYGTAYEGSNCAEGDQSLLRPETPQKSKCLLLDALLSYINTAVSHGF